MPGSFGNARWRQVRRRYPRWSRPEAWRTAVISRPALRSVYASDGVAEADECLVGEAGREAGHVPFPA
jgi:hypothetical protein